jgi:alpha-tubulin suppressor-like RCC1 family protein
MADRVCTRFRDDDGLDIGCHLVTKEHMLEAYPELVPWMKAPGLWGWGCNGASRRLGNYNITDEQVSSPVQTISGGTNWKQVTTASNHVAAIKTDGTLWTWGFNATGQLGIDAACIVIPGRSSPVQTISGGTNWKQVSARRSSSLATKTDGTLWGWGSGFAGVLGNNLTIDQSSPVQTISGGTNWRVVNSGRAHVGAIKCDGTLWMWGCQNMGRIGNGVTSFSGPSSPVQTISGGTNWKQVNLGRTHSSAIKDDGTLWMWGTNGLGELGTNQKTSVYEFTAFDSNASWAFDTDGTSYYQKAATGRYEAAAIKTDGTLWLWGDNFRGQLGVGELGNRSSPVQTISGGTNWKQISLNDSHAAAIKTDGTLWLWGCGGSGRIGDDFQISRSSPVQTVSGGTDWKQVSLGTCSTAAVKTNGTLWTWGNASVGFLGNNTSTINRSSPIQTISGGTNWKQVSIDTHVAAVKTDGTLWLWGCGVCGRLGNGATSNQSSPVQTVSGGTNWKQVSVGRCHTAAVKTDGTLWLWGAAGGSYQSVSVIGNNCETNRSSPVQTSCGGSDWKFVSAGYESTLAVKTDNTLWAWGVNTNGRIGLQLPSPGQGSSIPRCVRSNIRGAYSSSGWHAAGASMIISSSNCLYTTGSNNYAIQGLNTGATISYGYSSPTQTVSGGNNWKQVNLGYCHTTAIKTDGTLWLWGQGSDGALGNNSENVFLSPVQTVSGGTNWRQVAGTQYTTAAVKTDGTLWLWGRGSRGQLGNGFGGDDTLSRDFTSSPVQTIMGGTGWRQVDVGYFRNTFAIRDEGDS